MNPTLLEIYQNHQGLASDKWTSYLTEYQRLLAPYQDQKITLVEIGVQNGGSLQIWEKFFPLACRIIGCDIDSGCEHLPFNSPIIKIIIGDITNSNTINQIIQASTKSIDIVIDDGSHVSGDIVSAFFGLFPAINHGGLFIAEDLHCSYWPDFEGGLARPDSSIAFFKMLSDIVNYEHWGTDKSRVEYLQSHFPQAKDCEVALSKIHSIEFVNSLCVVRKRFAEQNLLGPRFIAGKEEYVCQIKQKNGQISKPLL